MAKKKKNWFYFIASMFYSARVAASAKCMYNLKSISCSSQKNMRKARQRSKI